MPLLCRMGSFTSMPKVIPAASECDCDADVSYPRGREELPEFLARCSRNLGSLPPPIERKWTTKKRSNINSNIIEDYDEHDDEVESESCEKIRVLQWNVLSQGE